MRDIIKKYSYLGNYRVYVPEQWKPIIIDMIINMDRSIRPRWIPLWLMNFLHKLSKRYTSVEFIYAKMVDKTQIKVIKAKYARLEVYGDFSDTTENIRNIAKQKCNSTCERCGSTTNVLHSVEKTGASWIRNYCIHCRTTENYITLDDLKRIKV